MTPEEFAFGEVEDPGQSLDDELVDGIDYRTYAFLEVTSTLMGSLSDEAFTLTTSTKHVSWARKGCDITWEETMCSLEITKTFGTQLTFPPAFIETFPIISRTARISEAVTGATFTAGPAPTVMGAILDDPLNEELPTLAEDPRVYDQDADGKPGFTVLVEQDLLGDAEMYLVQRDTNVHDGVVVSTDRIEGLLTTKVEQVIIEASKWWADTQMESGPDPEPAHSWFILQEVDETTNCSRILAQQDELFAR